MTVTRKEFLTLVAAGAATAALSPRELLAANGNGFDAAQLKKAVGQTFRLQGRAGNSVDLVLKAFVDKPNPKTTQFSLSFVSTEGARLAEGVYDLSSKSLGSMSMFITPTGVSNGQTSYRADFNLLPTTNGRK